jgi:hypothetical protein
LGKRSKPLTQLAKTLCLSYYGYVFSSTKSVTRAQQDLLETEEGRGGRVGEVGRVEK